jgi:23S rRNA pseudouridine2604 synthase
VQSDNENSTSLNKYISSTGFCSRREADEYIEQGRVSINRKIAKKTNRVIPGDEVRLDGELVKRKKRSIYIAFNKPEGIICTTDISEKNNIISYINYKHRLFPIGRLDKQSEGLIFLTDDGDVVNKILRAGNNHNKEYIVTVDKVITQKFIDRMSNGIPILGTRTRKCEVKKLGEYKFKIILTQGLNRQIRRMCNFLDYKVKTLKRTRIMHMNLTNLKVGEWRYFTLDELNELQKMIQHSSKTADPSAPKKKKFYSAKGKQKSQSRFKPSRSKSKSKTSFKSKSKSKAKPSSKLGRKRRG